MWCSALRGNYGFRESYYLSTGASQVVDAGSIKLVGAGSGSNDVVVSSLFYTGSLAPAINFSTNPGLGGSFSGNVSEFPGILYFDIIGKDIQQIL